MNPIAIFYHIYMGGGVIPCDTENVIGIVTEQLAALNVSGLSRRAQHIEIGVTGSELDHFMIKGMAPLGAHVAHNLTGVGELPTMKMMQDFCRDHHGWYVLYIHTKGAIYKGFQQFVDWRHCMENAVIWRWESCYKDLEAGVDSCGAHWLTPARYPIIGNVPYWGGNFFWAKSNFLNTLPPIDVNADRYQAEVWIGKGKRPPKVRDYAIHWPGAACHK